ncbi:Anaphase-promoting complex (APC), subunit 1 (meiotic check point regulator/Tsg24) [Phaffia rhodozyma]|uniref:Anaphase-promoting complex (APC), subunit 1 (Meiotic check point regulator/Tsg24) n=1 Tax=Phaffia rhodozyma TaxID=264483 RepID=A0A0F7SXC8_PHARH|nr:Anaphase-promoting complex (APC), subunit 1 (meiotic check point regulator/Tsg24) [Phaffia rhodozyma]
MHLVTQQTAHAFSPGAFAFAQDAAFRPSSHQGSSLTTEEPPSALRLKLRSIFASSLSSCDDPSAPTPTTPTFQTYISSPFSVSSADLDVPAEEELTWLGNKVIWSKGIHIHRTYTFPDKAVVKHAFFAWFDQQDESIRPSTSRKETLGEPVPFSSFSLSPSSSAFISEGTRVAAKSSGSNSSSSPKNSSLHSSKSVVRAICFLFSGTVEVYLPSGSAFTVPFPGVGVKAWALDLGIMIETEPKASLDIPNEVRRSREEGIWKNDLRFYVLEDPLRGIRPVWIQIPPSAGQLSLTSSGLNPNDLVNFLHVFPYGASLQASSWPSIAIAQHGSSSRLSVYRTVSPSAIPLNKDLSIPVLSASSIIFPPKPPTVHPPSPNTSLSFSWRRGTPSKLFSPKPSARSPYQTALPRSTSAPTSLGQSLHKSVMGVEFTAPGERADLNMSMDRLVLIQPGKEEEVDRAGIAEGAAGLGPDEGEGRMDNVVCWEIVGSWEEDSLAIHPSSTLGFVLVAEGKHDASLRISHPSSRLARSFRLSVREGRINMELQSKDEALDDLEEDATKELDDQKITSSCWRALKNVLPRADARMIRRQVMISSEGKDVVHSGWSTFSSVLLGHLGLGPIKTTTNGPLSQPSSAWENVLASTSNTQDPALQALRPPFISPPSPIQLGIQTKDPALTASVLQALHLVAEECKLDLGRYYWLNLLGEVLIRLAAGLGRRDWVDYWGRLIPRATHGLTGLSMSAYMDMPSPRDVYVHLSSLMLDSKTPPPWPSFSTASLSCISAPHSNFRIDPTPHTTALLAIYASLSPITSPGLTYAERCARTVSTMVSRGFGVPELLRLPLGVATPLFEALRTCQAMPPPGLSEHEYDLIGREDLGSRDKKAWKERRGRPRRNKLAKQSINQLAELSSTSKVQPIDLVPSTNGALRLGSDRRLEEVERMLSTTRVVGLTVKCTLKDDDPELPSFQKTTALNAARRTSALPIGQGMFKFSSCVASSTRPWPIQPIEYTVRLFPDKTVVPQDRLILDNRDWPDFHNGVAAGLRIESGGSDINSSWIVFNKPVEHNATHAGFLFGLGLNGHLRDFMPWHTLPYLDSRHEFTVIGLLLGLASSNVGNQDELLTKILSLHIQALLPHGAPELHASPLTQASALVGIGMLYMGSRNRRMAEMALSEISRRSSPSWASFRDHQEAYAFSAAISFGMIMVGRGGDVETQGDVDLVSRLKMLMFGITSVASVPEDRTIDINVTACGSTLALGLMYLKSGRSDIAKLLEIPTSVHELQLVRPDIILVRTLSRNLVLWDEIGPSDEWIRSLVPDFLKGMVGDEKSIRQAKNQNEELAYFNILAGACFTIGLKYAGTARSSVHSLLLRYYDFFWSLSHVPATSFKQRIRLATARSCLGLIAISLAAVMSGTGELSVLSRLRLAHGSLDRESNYGFHSAIHMALGLLFLGGGKHTLGSSNQAIASMVCAFFPTFNITENENRSYPQPFRHLWALAVEARCFAARDIDTDDTVYLPVKVRIREDGKIGCHQLISPTLLPPIDRLVSVRVESPRYWPIDLDLGGGQLGDHSMIPVKRRAGFQSYAKDPKGNHSIFVVGGLTTGLADLGPIQSCLSDRTGFDQVGANADVFVNDLFLRSFVRLFCAGPTAGATGPTEGLVKLCRASFVETLIKDHPQLVFVNVQLDRLARARPGLDFLPLFIQDLHVLKKHVDALQSEFNLVSSGTDVGGGVGTGAGVEMDLGPEAGIEGRQTLIRASAVHATLLTIRESSLGIFSSSSDPRDYVQSVRASALANQRGNGEWRVSPGLAMYIASLRLPPLTELSVLSASFARSFQAVRAGRTGVLAPSDPGHAPGPDGSDTHTDIDREIKHILNVVVQKTIRSHPRLREWDEFSRNDLLGPLLS